MPDICLWNRCNNHCVMCTNPVGFQSEENAKNYSYKKFIERIKRSGLYLKTTKDNINLTGGEPTTHPYFLELLKWLRKNFPENRIVLATNGRRFSYPWFAKRVLEIENLVIEIAILGPNEKLHDAITRTKGSFEQTIQGISNILQYRKLKSKFQELELRIILVKQNYKIIGEILSLIYNKFPLADRVVIIFPEPEGVCKVNFQTVGLTYKQVKKEIVQVMKKWKDKFNDLRLYHFPLCTLPSTLWKYTWITQRPEEVSYLSICDRCLYRKYCCGIHGNYLKIVGKKEFKPIKESFNFRIGNNPYHPIIGVY